MRDLTITIIPTIQVGSIVRFYDCDRANKDRNYSGDEKYYSTGTVIKRYITDRRFFIDQWLGGDDVVDIRLIGGRVSHGHFVNRVDVIRE
mgnify:CR=1 FL=1